MKVLAGIRTAVYMTGFVLLWGWLALGVRQFDPAIGVTLPKWVKLLGFAVMATGGVLGLTCGYFFATHGRGTPAPFDSPREFVAVGPYRYVRNPMYIGGSLVLGGSRPGLALPVDLLADARRADLRPPVRGVLRRAGSGVEVRR